MTIPRADASENGKRDGLADYSNTRQKFSGVFQRFGFFREGFRECKTACIVELEMGGKRVCQHVWVHYAKPFQDLVAKTGDRFEFSALVKEYRTQRPPSWASTIDYNLTAPTDVRLVEHAPPAPEPIKLFGQPLEMKVLAKPEPPDEQPEPEEPKEEPRTRIPLAERRQRVVGFLVSGRTATSKEIIEATGIPKGGSFSETMEGGEFESPERGLWQLKRAGVVKDALPEPTPATAPEPPKAKPEPKPIVETPVDALNVTEAVAMLQRIAARLGWAKLRELVTLLSSLEK